MDLLTEKKHKNKSSSGLSWGQCHPAELHPTSRAFAHGQRQSRCACTEPNPFSFNIPVLFWTV